MNQAVGVLRIARIAIYTYGGMKIGEWITYPTGAIIGGLIGGVVGIIITAER